MNTRIVSPAAGIILLTLFLLSLGCIEQQAIPSPTPAAPSPSLLPSPFPSPSLQPSPTPSPSAVPSPLIQVIASAVPSPAVESIVDLVHDVEKTASRVFNRTVILERESETYYAESVITATYRSEIVVQTSPYAAWSAFDSPRVYTGTSGKKKEVSVTKERMGVTVFEAKMQCFNWRYLIEFKITEGAEKYVGYGEKLVAELIDACP